MIDLNEKLKGYRFDLSGYLVNVLQRTDTVAEGITWADAGNCFKLSPEPERLPIPGDYIALAQNTRLLDYVFFYLHHSEGYINRKIKKYIPSAEHNRMQAAAFMDLKYAWRDAVLEHFTDYDPSLGVGFNSFIDRYARDAILTCFLQEEAWSCSSLDSYKKLRRAAVISSSSDSYEESLHSYMRQYSCTEETARQWLMDADAFRNRVIPAQEDSDDYEKSSIGDEIFSDHYDYVSVLWNGMEARVIDKAFEKLSYRDQDLLEKRNAICMSCGRVSPMSKRMTFEEIARRYEMSGTAGAEKAYSKAVKRLAQNLRDSEAISVVGTGILVNTTCVL